MRGIGFSFKVALMAFGLTAVSLVHTSTARADGYYYQPASYYVAPVFVYGPGFAPPPIVTYSQPQPVAFVQPVAAYYAPPVGYFAPLPTTAFSPAPVIVEEPVYFAGRTKTKEKHSNVFGVEKHKYKVENNPIGPDYEYKYRRGWFTTRSKEKYK